MRAVQNRKGLMFAVAAAIFVVVMFSVLLIRIEQNREHGVSLVYRVRCDELNSFLDDATKDLQRATGIAATRALIYGLGAVVTNGTPLQSAEMNLNEMTLNSTLRGQDVPDLQNQTLKNWSARMNFLASVRNFTTNFDPQRMEIDTSPHTPWDYWVRIRVFNLTVNDSFGYCAFLR